MPKKNIKKILEILYKKYPSTTRTTLNRMRLEKNRVASGGGKEKMPPLSTSRKEREENQGVSSPFKILISCLLSLRARDENTEKVSKRLFAVADTPEKILKLSLRKLEKIIFSSGHYRKKARVLKSVSKEILKRFSGKVPDTKEELLSIKGVGPKTANIVLAFAFGKCVIPVDTHCHRIPNRLGWVKTKNPNNTEIELMKIIPDKDKYNFNSVFVQFGREICQPISPRCSICPIEKFCPKIGVKKSR